MARAGRGEPRVVHWMLLGLVLTGLVLGLRSLSTRSDVPDRAVAYVDEVRADLELGARGAGDLADVRRRAADLGPAASARRMARLERHTAESLRRVERVEPPDRLRRAHNLLVASMAARNHGTKTFSGALADAFAGAAPEAVVSRVVDAGRDLIAADRNYELFVEAVGRRDAALPPARWVDDPALWSAGEAGLFVATLRASTSGAPVRDSAIVTLATQPAAVRTDGGVLVLPPAKTLGVSVVVANIGNEVQRRVPVVAELHVEGEPADTARQFVDLAPGQRVAVRLGGLRPPPADATLVVRVGPLDGETNLGDNERTLRVRLG